MNVGDKVKVCGQVGIITKIYGNNCTVEIGKHGPIYSDWPLSSLQRFAC